MGRLRTSGIDEVIQAMKDAGELIGAVADEMLFAAAEATKKAWRAEALRRNFVLSGDMINSIGYSRKTTKASDIRSIDVYPQGKDRTGTRNAEKAFILHYGSSKFAPTNWVDDAEALAAEATEAAMTEIWDRFLQEKGLI